MTVDEPCAAKGVPRRELESVGGSRRGKMKQGEESAAVKIIKHRCGSTAQIILGTASAFARHALTNLHKLLRKIQEESLLLCPLFRKPETVFFGGFLYRDGILTFKHGDHLIKMSYKHPLCALF